MSFVVFPAITFFRTAGLPLKYGLHLFVPCPMLCPAVTGPSVRGSKELIVLDAPWSFHWPKLLLWTVTEGLIIAQGEISSHRTTSSPK